jgi:hypothetical protein
MSESIRNLLGKVEDWANRNGHARIRDAAYGTFRLYARLVK